MHFILVLVRHGETDGNTKRLLQGHYNLPLNKTGHDQAMRAGLALKGETFKAAYTSDLLRANQTTKDILGQGGVTRESKGEGFKRWPLLRERCMGVFDGLQWSDFEAEATAKLRSDGDDKENGVDVFAYVPEGAESLPEFGERVERAFKEICLDIKETCSGTSSPPTILWVSHGGFIWSLMDHLKMDLGCDMPESRCKLLPGNVVPNTAISRFSVKLDEEGIVESVECIYLNDAAHLKEGLS